MTKIAIVVEYLMELFYKLGLSSTCDAFENPGFEYVYAAFYAVGQSCDTF